MTTRKKNILYEIGMNQPDFLTFIKEKFPNNTIAIIYVLEQTSSNQFQLDLVDKINMNEFKNLRFSLELIEGLYVLIFLQNLFDSNMILINRIY